MADEQRRRPTRRGRRPPCAPPPCGPPSATWSPVAPADLGDPCGSLDLGGGTGGLAVPLAELGHHVTVVDPSPDALAALARRAGEAGVADRVTAVQGDADTCSRCTPRDRTSTWSAATARSRSSTTPPRPSRHRRGARRRRPPQPARRPAPRRRPRPGPRRPVRPGPRGPRPAPTAAGARATRCRAGSTRAGLAALLGEAGLHRQRLPRRPGLQRPRPVGLHRLRGRPRRPAGARAARPPPPRLAFLGQLGAALHVLARRA